MEICPLVLAVVLVSSALACSPEGYRWNIPLDEMAHDSPIIAHGTVTKIYPVTADNQSFTAEFEVMCTYKGGPIEQLINITNGGSWPGLCGYKNFTAGVEYIAFLDGAGRSYSHRYDTTKTFQEAFPELITFCGLTVEYPTSGNTTVNCVPPQEQGCKRYTEFPEPPPPPPSSVAIRAPAPPKARHMDPPLFSVESSGDVDMMTTEDSMSMYNETLMVVNETTTSAERTTLPTQTGSTERQEGEDMGYESTGMKTALSTVCLCLCAVVLSLS